MPNSRYQIRVHIDDQSDARGGMILHSCAASLADVDAILAAVRVALEQAKQRAKVLADA